jgi:hypothetical protein
MHAFISVLKKIAVLIVVVAIGAFVFLNMANYSTGFRSGVPIKISKKGVLFKTWEGQLNVGGLTTTADGTIPTQWDFTVKNAADSVLDKIDEAILHGKRVKLLYDEKYAHFFWLGDTKYFVYDVEMLE